MIYISDNFYFSYGSDPEVPMGNIKLFDLVLVPAGVELQVKPESEGVKKK